METERHFHWTALVISGLTAVFLWCIACSFYSKAVNLCPGVEVKWENGGVSPAALVKQQTFSRQDGAAEQPEVTLWQAASGYEVMSGDRKSMAADMVVVFGDCRAVTAAAMLSGRLPGWKRSGRMRDQLGAGVFLVGKHRRLRDAGNNGRRQALCARRI